MTSSLSEESLLRLSKLIGAHTGLHFPRERWTDLERGIAEAAPELGMRDAEACRTLLLSSALSKNQIEILADHLTVGETYFFRESESFKILEKRVFSELINSRRGHDQRLRVWSAGCCTGEEPYSVAILLSRMIPDLRDWDVTILATDISPRSLGKAQAGVYGEWSFRAAPPWLKTDYFRRTPEGRYELLPHVREMVTFLTLNLADDTYPSPATDTNAMDVILCRNVLLYFSTTRVNEVVQRLGRSLVEGGWLMLSPSEMPFGNLRELGRVSLPAGALRKRAAVPDPTAPIAGGEVAVNYGLSEVAWSPKKPANPAVAMSPSGREVPEPKEPPALNLPEQGRFEEAINLYRQGRYEEAKRRAVESLGDNPIDGRGPALLGRICADRGELAEAVVWCEKSIAADKLKPGSHYLLASIMVELGRTDEAGRAFRRALYLDPAFVLAHFALGNLADHRGRSREAERHFRNALSLLVACPPETPVAESEGLTASRLIEIIRSAIGGEVAAR